MGRMGHTGLLGQLGRWAAVAAVAAGAWLCGARVAWADPNYVYHETGGTSDYPAGYRYVEAYSGASSPSALGTSTVYAGDKVVLRVKVEYDGWIEGANFRYRTGSAPTTSAGTDVACSWEAKNGDGGAAIWKTPCLGPWAANTKVYYVTWTWGWSDPLRYANGKNDFSGSTKFNFTVQPLNAPTGVSATPQGKTSIKLDWTRGISGNAKNTLIVRNTTGVAPTINSPWNYYVGQNPTGGTTIYKDSGTTFTDTGLTEGTTYYYFFYAENYEYHSAAATASATTYGVVSKTANSVTIGGAGNGYRVWAGKKDVLDYAAVGGSTLNNGSMPTAWTATGSESGAEYAGRARRRGTVAYEVTHATSGGTTAANYNGGLWTTKSGGTALRRVHVSWAADYTTATATNSTGSRNIDIYGRAAVYADASALGTAYQGTYLCRLVRLTSSPPPDVDKVIAGDYANISLGSQYSQRAVSVTYLSFEWEKAGSTTTSASWGDGVTLTGLEPDTEYTWGVANGTTLIASGTFRTEANAVVVPTVGSPTAAGISASGATLGATVTDNGGAALTGGGVVYSSTASTPTVGGSGCTSASYGTPTVNTPFTKAVSGLTADTLYYYRGYAQNGTAAGYGYSGVGQFRTTASAPGAPSVTVEHASSYKTSRLHITAEKAAGSAGTLIMIYTASAMTGPSDRTGYTGNVAWGSAAQINSQGRVVYVGTDASPSINVTGLSAGTTYYVRAYAYNGTSDSTAALNSLAYSSSYGSGSMATLAEEPSGAPSLSVTAKTQTTMTLSVTKGTGATDTLIIARAANAPSGNPTDGTGYAADAAYGSGAALQNGYVVLSGSGTSVEVTGLTAGTRYYFWAFAYTGSGNSANYYTTSKGTLNDSTLATAPSTSATATLAGTGTTTATATYTRPSADSAGVVLVMKAGSAPTWTPTAGEKPASANAAFGSGTQVATGEYAVYDGDGGAGASASTRNVTGLTPGTEYFVRGYAYAGGADAYAYSAGSDADSSWTLSTEPGTQASGLTAGTVGSRKASLTWTAGAVTLATGESGTLKTLLIAVPSGSSVTAPTDGETYAAGATLGAGTVVFAGTGTSAEATGLTPETTYTIYAYAYTEGGDTTTANYLTTSPATRSITTTASTGPNVWATGVDATSYLLNWSQLDASTGYDVQTRTSGGSWADALRVVFTNSFSSNEGWSDQSGTASNSVTVAGRVWAWSGVSGTNFRLYSTGTGISGDTGQVRFQKNGQYVVTPVLTGPISVVKVKWKATAATQKLRLYSLTGSGFGTKTTLATWTRSSTTATDTYTFSTPATGAVRLMLEAYDGVPDYNTYAEVAWIEVLGPQSGHSDLQTGLTAGTTYEGRVRKNPDGDWSEELSVKAGVVPSGLSAGTATRNTAPFTWSGVNSPAGYRVQATTNAAGNIVTTESAGETTGQAWPKVCPTTAATLTLNNTDGEGFGSISWKYIGTACNAETNAGYGHVRTSPKYGKATYNSTDYTGHWLVGDEQGIESKPFPIAGATTLKLSYTILAWNLNLSGASLENGRVDAYYKLDDGPWCLLGSGVPSGNSDGNSKQQTWTLEKGMLDGTEIAFRIVAPNGSVVGSGSSTRMTGVYVQALKVYCTAKGLGDYTETVADAKTASGSYTVTGLDADCPVYFRVQALQGNLSTPTAKSVWVEEESETTGFSGPATVTASGETRNGMTLAWDAVSGAASYNVEWTTCGVDSSTAEQEGETCPSSTRAYDTHSATDWTYRKGYSASAGYSAGAYPYWHGTAYGHWLAGQYVNTTYKPGVESPNLDLSDAASGYVSFGHKKANDGTNTLATFSPVTLYYSLDGGTTWTQGSGSDAGTGSWVTKTIALPSAVLGRKNVRLQLRADKAAAYYDTSVSAYKPAGAGIKDIQVYKYRTGGNYECAATQRRTGVTGTTTALTGLNAETLYYFRVQAVGSGDGATSTWTAGSSSTTAFEGPAASVTGSTRYTLTAGWAAYSESGYTTSYDVQLTGCAKAGAEAATVGSCPAQNLSWGSSASAWTYQREYSGSTASSYPKYESGVHKLWGQYSSTTVEPGILSPELDLAGYVAASVEFTHLYVNRANMSGVTLEYSLDEGETWVVVANTGEAAGYTLATGSSRSLALPAEALAGGVKLRLRTTHATNYDTTGNGDYLAQGASIANLKVVARGAGGGDYTCEDASAVYNTDSTSYTFTGLDAGKSYYVQVRTVLTPSSGPVEMSSWSETSGQTAEPQSPPEEVWAENVWQNHMTVAWSEAEGATLYDVQLTGCSAGTWEAVGVQPSATNMDLGDGDDWTYVGGGEEVTTAQQTWITGRGTYPAWAGNPEWSQVLAGPGEPGLESVSFSTVGATSATLTFGSGRWYDPDSGDADASKLTLMYSTDDGASWTAWQTNGTLRTVAYAYNNVNSYALPAAALGHAKVRVRIVAEGAKLRSGDNQPQGAAVTAARVTLGGAHGDYESCTSWGGVQSATGLTAEQLTKLFGDATALTAGHTYYFRVRASDGTQYGDWVEGSATTVAAPGTPETPWAVDVGRHAMTIRWQPVDGAETYTVVVYKNGTQVKTQSGVANTEWMVTGLDGSTTYTFKVSAQADGESSALSAEGTATTTAKLRVTGLRAEDILDTSMTLKWDQVSGVTYTLHWGEASAEGTVTLNQEVACPASTLKRSDAGNKWFYFGGNGSWPAYWTSTSDPANDHGHALIYNAAGQPGIQSRWFSTFDASAAYVEFLHGRFNSGADSTVLVEYSIDGGATWATAGTAESTTAATPTEARSIPLPEAALGRRSVMVRLTATGASGNKGAHVKDLQVRVVTSEANAGSYTTVNNSQLGSSGSYALSGLTSGKRYWFEMFANEGGSTAADDNAKAETTAATRTKTTGAVKSQGFEGPSGNGALDTVAWGYTVKWIPVQNGSATAHTTRQSGDPEVAVVADENPLYGDRALRMSGSAAAGVYGVVEFADYNPGGANSWVVTIPFAVRDLASGENLWVTYSTDGGSTWVAPAGLATLTKSGMTMGKIARGGDDTMNQNWPYNKGLNSTTRPGGDAYSFEVSEAARLMVRVAFCGNSGSAAHYVYIDGVTLTRKPGMPTPVSATAQDSGGVLLEWTAPEGQGVVILRGQDERHVPASPVDVENIPHGYEIVMNGDSPYWPNDVGSFTDMAVQSGWTYYYYFYGAVAEGGTYTLGTTPNTANALVKGMVQAIASQGWDDFDIHPWGYRLGRVTNPGRSSDYGFWKEKGMNATPVAFVENSYETDSTHPTTVGPTGERYATYYGTGDGAGDADKAKQLGVSSQTNYYGGHSFRLSGGGSATYSGTHVWTDYDGNVKTNTAPAINTNNAAIEFANVDLSGYKNVEFTMHFAGMNLNGGNDLHVAISTNGGAAGSWLEVANNNEAGWRVYESHYDYGRAISDGDTRLRGNWNFYFEDSARATPYGNPYVLQVPDTVTQFMVRVMFYDSNGGSRRNASYFIDEVRLTGEVAIEAPHPVLTDISKTELTASWEAVPDATGYNVKLTACEKSGAVQLQEGFVLSVLDNGWTGEGEYELTSAANRRGSGYGVSLNAKDEAAISPMVGAASSVSFWLSSSSANSGAKMEVQARAEGETTWVTVAEYTAPGTTWAQKTVQLPRRQWQQVRFVKTVSPSTVAFRIDDVVISGGGNYESCSTKLVSATTTATNYTFTGLSEGTEYFVEVQAYGSPAGYLAYSAWAETADYTPGTFAVAADGFEMTRSTWGASASVPILVMAVNEGKAFSEATVPTGDPAVGTAFGEGVVIARGTSAQAAPGFEHVVPYGSRTEPVEAKYVAFWKHGSYWEGRLETNVVLGTYVCAAADAMAYTNGVAVGSSATAGSDTPYAGGKGWTGPWKLSVRHGESWNNAIIDRNGSGPEGLIETNQIQGAGGNMVKLMPGGSANSKQVALKRQLAADLSANSDWWGMFTMKVTHPHDHSWAGIRLLGTDGNEKASVGNVWNNNSSSKPAAGISDTVSSYEIGANGTYVYVFKWDGGQKKMYLHVQYVADTSTPVWNPSVAATLTLPDSWTWDVNGKIITGMTDIRYIELAAQNNNGSDEYVGDVWFDEIRVGESWQDIVGKETEAPFPVTSAEAWTDGNELVRVSWTYAAAGMDGTIERPLADGVRVYQSEDAGTTWTQIYQGKGTNEAAVAAGGISRWDHVVAPGSTHRYKVEAYAAGKSAAAVNAALKDSSPATYDVATGTYGATEYVNPFSYTNWSVVSTASGLQWLGGNGFGENYWAPGSGSAGTWSIATPEEAQAAVHITNVVTGARLAAGNVLKVSGLGDGETADISRTLAGDAWCGSAGQTFYVAFRMAYQWGDNGGRQVGLRLTDDTGKYVQFGKARGDGSGYQHRFGVTASPNGTGYTSGWSTGGDDMPGYGTASDAAKAYLVVGKVNWSASGKANLRAVHYGIGTNGTPATLPSEESSVTWEASYDNAGIGAIRKIELIAGTASSGYGTIGTAWFDEIRFGTSWEDIVGATEPEDVWVDGIGVETADTVTRYLGDFATWYMHGWPKGAKQSAWVSLATSPAFTTILATNDTSWVENTSDHRGGQQTKWLGGEIQFTQTGTLYGGGSVKGELVTMNSWNRADHGIDSYKWNAYTVNPLPAPTVDSAVGGTAKATLRWTPATENGRTFTEVMVVRYTGDGAAPAPVQGTTYLKGEHIGSGTVVYRGTATSLVDKGLTKSTTYHYLFFTVNNGYYSLAAAADATTDENDPEIVIDGDPTDWVGEPSDVKNSSTVSSGEWIWTDKVLDGRVDKPGAYDADITEFRMKVDGNDYVNFMARLHCLTNKQNPYIAVGIVTNVDATQLAATGNEDGENWIGDESATFMGGNLFDPASLHYADIQMAVHWVTTAGANGEAHGSGGWVVELYRKDGNSWSAPVQAWEAASSENLAEDPCIEWKVKRSDLNLDYPNVTPARFTVASFVNGGGWNNDTEATVDLSSGTSHAVDSLCIAPWGVNDKDLALSAWDEGIKNANAEYWFDIWFGPTALHNASPNAPASYTLNGAAAENGQKVAASPVMSWAQCADGPSGSSAYRGFVVGYLVEVSTNEYFNGLEGTTENGPISCRVNVKGADTTSYRYKTDSRYYWWRVRARDNSGALSAPTPWRYEVEGKTDNEGPEARLLFVGPDADVARYVSDAAYRREQDLSGDATSVLDSDLEAGGQQFGFVIEWYDVNGVFATNWLRAWKEGDGAYVWPSSASNPYGSWTGDSPSVGDFAWNILAEHEDGTPFGRVSPNWDLIIVDRSTVGKDSPTVASETVSGTSYNYVMKEDLVLPTDDGGTETLAKVWIIDCGLDKVFQPTETINDGNKGQYVTNHVTGAFAIGTYRTDLDIYLTVSAEDSCTTGPYVETADYDWPLYDTSTPPDTGSYKAQGSASGTLSGFCAAAPNPSRNVTTNQLLHIHVRDNDTMPPVTSQAKWRADATGEGGTVLLPMMAVTSGGDASAPANWDPTWANLAAQGRVPTQEGQGKALQWQLTDGDVATYTHPATAGGSGTTAWKGSAAPIRLFFNVYDEYLHSGLASFKTYDAGTPWNASTWTAQDGMEGAYTSVANNQRTLRNTGLVMPGTAGTPTTNWTGYAAAWSKITAYEWTVAGNNEHGLGTGPDSVLAWQLDATQANLEGLLGQDDLLSNARIGIVNGEQQIVANAVRLHAIDNDNNAAGDQEGADLEFGQLIFTDDDATPPEMVGFTSAGTGTNFTHFGELGKWSWGSSYNDVTMTPLMGAIVMGGNVAGKLSSNSSTPESDSSVTPQWHAGKSAIYLQGNMNADTYRATNARYFEFKLGGNGNTVWRADMIAFYNRVSPTGPTKFALTMQGSAGIAYPAVENYAWYEATPWTQSGCTLETKALYTKANAVTMKSAQNDGNTYECTLTSPVISCADHASLKLDFAMARGGGKQSDLNLYVEYKTSDDSEFRTVSGWTFNHSSDFSQAVSATGGAGWYPKQIDVGAEIPGLMGSAKTVQIRFRAQVKNTAAGTVYGFHLADPKLTAGGDSSSERLLGTIEIEKMIATSDSTGGSGDAAEKAGSYANTETDVILGFDGQVEGYDDSLVTFRLYGYGATHLDEKNGVIDTSNTSQGTWAIKNLYIHGTASEPKKDEVTDYDVATGAWTNRLETLDGAMAGYDTVRSGLRVKDAAGEVSGEKPSFRILYPSAYNGAAPNGDPDGVVTTGDLVMKSVSDATFDTIADPDFAAGTGWTLANEAAIANGRLTLPGNGAVSSASRELALTSMAGVQSATIAGTVRVRGSLTAENGGVNTVTVMAQPYAGAATLGDPLVTNITANAAWKNYAVGPWAIPADTVTKVAFTVKQTGTDSTELLVDELRMHVAQWGADIHAEDAAWATSVTNGMPAAKAVVGTPELDLREVSVPLSVKSGSSMPQNQWYTLEATMHDFDGDRPGDALSASATTNFWLYDDDEVAPQYGSKYGGPLGVFLNGTIVPQAWRTGITVGQESSKLNQQWPITDAELTALAPADSVTFALSFYDYSGWYAKSLSLGGDTIVASRAIPAAAATRGWSAPEDNDGAPEAPGATSTWNIGAKNLYTAYKTAFEGTEGTVAEMTAEVWDKDNDRADDDLSFNSRVGYVWFTDSDIQAPQWGSQAEPYYGVMLSTNVPHSAEGYAAMLAQTAEDAPYAVGGLANNQSEFAGRSYTVYDGQLNALNASGNDKSFVVTANLNDPLPGFRARKVSGLQRGATLTEKRAMWGDDPNSPADAANVFTITNTYVVLTNEAAGTAVTNAAFDGTFSEPVSKTRVAMQAGHTSWTWSAFPTNDIGLLLPPGAASASVGLWIEAFDSDMNRHNDQMHASLAGPTITLRDDDTQAPTAPTAVKVNGEAVVAGSITRETAPWTNDLSQIQVSWTAATDPEPTGYDIKKAGIAGYRLASHDATIDPDAGSALAGTTTNGTTVSKALSGVTMDQGWDTYKLFAVDADADRPGDALAGTAADVPLAYDITLPTAVAPNGSATGSGNRLVADPDNTDDPTTQFDLTWPIDGIGPDDPSDTDHYNAIPAKYKAAGVKVSDREILSPWQTYKVYYQTFEESAVPSTDNPNSQENSWVYQQHILTEAYKTWPSVVATSTATDPTAAANPYDSLKAVTANAGSGKQTVRLYDLDFDQHYMVVVVGVDKAGNEGPAGMWSWATNNTIKFAVTQGVVKATAAINAEVGDLVSGQATNTVGMAKIAGDNAPAKAAALYWMAAGMKNGAGKVSKYYDLIYRDASGFSENGTEQWNMASTADNSGTSKTNWNYQADAGLSTPGRLRFYRASYTGRWQDTKPGTSEKQYPLASEEVYSMNNVVLSEGFNYVSLQGVPWTNTFRGVFGTDTDMWPGGTTAADAAVVEFYTPGSRGNIAVESYFFGADGKWYSSAGTTDVTDTLQADGFFARPFSINLPALATNEEGEVTGWWAEHDDSAVTARYNSRRLKGMMWHPILQVPTNAPTADGYTQTISGAAGTYNTLSLNLPVAVHPRQLGLGGIKKSNQPWLADKLYVVDTATKEVRGNTTMYCDANGVWRYNSNRAEVTGTPIKPNDMIVLISYGGDDWTWTYRPADFYALPTRHMGRTLPSGAGN